MVTSGRVTDSSDVERKRPWLIDPGVPSVVHREFDLGDDAPGSVASGLRRSPHTPEVAPLGRRGGRGRIPLHHLAPLAVHAIKFGGAYPAGLARALRALWRVGTKPRSSIGVDPV